MCLVSQVPGCNAWKDGRVSELMESAFVDLRVSHQTSWSQSPLVMVNSWSSDQPAAPAKGHILSEY